MQIPESIKNAFVLPLALFGVMVGVEFLDWFLTIMVRNPEGVGFLDRFGIRPRALSGVPGIFLAPFLHRDFAHLAANAFPFLFLGFILAFMGPKRFAATTFVIVVGVGTAVWLLGRPQSVHIGASGLIFGYIGYLLVKGFVERRGRWILVSILVAIVYSGYSRLLLPGFGHTRGISWESHLFGFLVGIAAAWWLAQRGAGKGGMEERVDRP